MDNLKFEKMNDNTWIAKFYNGTYSRFYHITDHGDHASLMIYGSNRKPEIKYSSVKKAMGIAKQEHNRWLSNIRKVQ